MCQQDCNQILNSLLVNAMLALAKYVLVLTRDKVIAKKLLLSSGLNRLVFKIETICGGCNSTLKYYGCNINSIKIDSFTASAIQCVFIDTMLSSPKQKDTVWCY